MKRVGVPRTSLEASPVSTSLRMRRRRRMVRPVLAQHAGRRSPHLPPGVGEVLLREYPRRSRGIHSGKSSRQRRATAPGLSELLLAADAGPFGCGDDRRMQTEASREEMGTDAQRGRARPSSRARPPRPAHKQSTNLADGLSSLASLCSAAQTGPVHGMWSVEPWSSRSA
jgi:hypothetical protein